MRLSLYGARSNDPFAPDSRRFWNLLLGTAEHSGGGGGGGRRPGGIPVYLNVPGAFFSFPPHILLDDVGMVRMVEFLEEEHVGLVLIGQTQSGGVRPSVVVLVVVVVMVMVNGVGVDLLDLPLLLLLPVGYSREVDVGVDEAHENTEGGQDQDEDDEDRNEAGRRHRRHRRHRRRSV